MEAAEITRLITDALPDARVEIQDLRGDGDHFEAYVESAAFEGKSMIQQHQMVFTALQGRVGCVIRAFSLTTALPAVAPSKKR